MGHSRLRKGSRRREVQYGRRQEKQARAAHITDGEIWVGVI